LSSRAREPFVPINCAAIPETLLESELFGHKKGAFTGALKQTIGRIESADLGTLFLDEIGDVPLPMQVKLLRFLQNQMIERVGGRQPVQVDVRIVCATNQDLDLMMAEGRFREDLYYRLNEVNVRVPPLRERASDAIVLASFFMRRFTAEYGRSVRGFDTAALAAMSEYAWPGNVRELENRVKRAVVMTDGPLLSAADLGLAASGEKPHRWAFVRRGLVPSARCFGQSFSQRKRSCSGFGGGPLQAGDPLQARGPLRRLRQQHPTPSGQNLAPAARRRVSRLQRNRHPMPWRGEPSHPARHGI
jgi:transcriptional regulator with GAF, ATPase, and Fis domain